MLVKSTRHNPMHLGTDYYPEHWVYPLAGTPESPESRWQRDAELMVAAGMNVVRLGEFAWGLYEPEEGRMIFDWMKRAMDVMAEAGLKIMLGTPTAAPPLMVEPETSEILPVDERGQRKQAGTRKAYCMNSDVYWGHCRKIITELVKALGQHPGSDRVAGRQRFGQHQTVYSFNDETRRDWHAWLKAKYETVERAQRVARACGSGARSSRTGPTSRCRGGPDRA
jgi:beta-galactosidase